ncbi:glycerophosphodiester phosphodiesterase [Aeromicrobium sp. PE09-221]|uniref:glycerophosphodiester phosphodiesterase family protein n=1 Tax=Aeromicrobium sp. PE09-221 TaxID=1898043 RepID=UPI000B3EE16D|nr:glycerophosphodiester phosphodiesterase family protein [Aeromicrobium sp. PE09-221]OUZ08667.1 glycerophosphodiester phosphodiesterase [Aeromicrobium sp. PE09-221]
MSAPTVIAHRGVPGSRLEHTADSYLLAIEQGADYIEPDLVVSRDGVLVVRHENELSDTTDVAKRPAFADRKTTKRVDGASVTGWFAEDFTVAELKSLGLRERFPALRRHNEDGAGEILTLDEVLDIAAAENTRRGRDEPRVGVCPETKHPTYFAENGIDIDGLLLARLEAWDLNHEDADFPVILQSMEPGNLRRLRARTPLPLIQLLEHAGAPYDLIAAADTRDYAFLASAPGLAFIAEYADGVGAHKSLVIGRDGNDRLSGPTSLVRDAHELGLAVHVWTLRDENRFLPAEMRIGQDAADHGDALAEYLAFYDAGVDGVFSDFTASAITARDRWERRSPSATGSPAPGA